MTRKLITLATVLLFKQFCSAQTQVTVTYNYTGTISKYPVEMQLLVSRETDTLDGEYYYVKSGIDAKLWVRGVKGPGNSINLTEKDFRQRDKDDQFRITGLFTLTGTDTLSGSWKNPNTGALLPVKLAMREKLSGLQPADYKFKLRTYKGEMTDAGNHQRMYTKINQLEIYYQDKLHQRIGGFDQCVDNNRPEVIMEDLNFDGYLDLKVPVYFPERVKNDGSFLYFIYNKASRQFEMHQQLTELEYLIFDPVKKEVSRYDQGAEGFITNYYKWKDGKVYLARTETEEQ